MLLDKVKTALRVKTVSFDVEITGLIDACILDLKTVGITKINMDPAEGEEATAGDPLLERAVILYAKANFGFGENTDCVRFQKAYDSLKHSLCLAGDYIAVE